jgi:hypothetical protein
VRKLIQLFMNEPAVALGVIAAAVVTAMNAANGGSVTGPDVIAILTPFATALGIRQLVVPACTASPVAPAPPTEQSASSTTA